MNCINCVICRLQNNNCLLSESWAAIAYVIYHWNSNKCFDMFLFCFYINLKPRGSLLVCCFCVSGFLCFFAVLPFFGLCIVISTYRRDKLQVHCQFYIFLPFWCVCVSVCHIDFFFSCVFLYGVCFCRGKINSSFKILLNILEFEYITNISEL